MSRLIATLAVTASLLAGAATANAYPKNALAEAARSGQLTPGGVWDGR